MPPFPVSNRMAAEEAARLGAGMVHAHVELPEEERRSLRKGSPVPVEDYRGNPVILATRAAVKAKEFLECSDGTRFLLKKQNGFTCLYEDL